MNNAPLKFLSLKGECVTEKVIEKSRFITTSRHVDGEDGARAFIEEIRSKYKDATHNCYAYIPDIQGNFPRFSDDGEPQGTAGMPMLEVIKNKRLVQTAVVVTRYFGGVKLGAGGLVRAYSGAVAENLSAAAVVCFQTCSELKVFTDYSVAENVTRFIAERKADLIDTAYADGVVFTVAVKKEDENGFLSSLTNRLNGRLKTEKIKEYYFPFRV